MVHRRDRTGQVGALSGHGRSVKIPSMRNTVCDKSVREKIGSDWGWEIDEHGAFLTPFLKAIGVTVVMPGTNSDDDVFSQEDDYFHNAERVVSYPTTTGDKA